MYMQSHMQMGLSDNESLKSFDAAITGFVWVRTNK